MNFSEIIVTLKLSSRHSKKTENVLRVLLGKSTNDVVKGNQDQWLKRTVYRVTKEAEDDYPKLLALFKDKDFPVVDYDSKSTYGPLANKEL